MSQVPNHIKPQVWIHAAILKIDPFPRPISPSFGASSLFLPVDSSPLYKPMSISSGSTSKSISSGSTSKFVSYHFSLNWIVCIQRIVGLNLIGFNL
jgi:CBS-domain-containing membrane protein